MKAWNKNSVVQAVKKEAARMIETKGVVNLNRLVWSSREDLPSDKTVRNHCGMSLRELIDSLHAAGEIPQPSPQRKNIKPFSVVANGNRYK